MMGELTQPMMRIMQLLRRVPTAAATIKGSSAYPNLRGVVRLYPMGDGTLLTAEVFGLPKTETGIFGFHIHAGTACSGNATDPFADAEGHFSPVVREHPMHAGDLPPLFADTDGTALMAVYTDRFTPQEVIGHAVIVHAHPDDFHTQPAGDSGMKIACGLLRAMRN
jgi:Cu-Zn family superoxide dismutase